MASNPYAPDAPAGASPRNDLALAGFIISIAGFLTAGILCPVGLVISLVALGREPRGFAIAGAIIGGLGSCTALLVGGMILLGLGAGLLAAIGIATVVALSQPQKLEITADMAQVAALVEDFRDANGRLPLDLDEAGVPEGLQLDPWGVGYRIDPFDAAPGFDVRSAGEDGIFDSDDDVRLSGLDELWGGDGGPFRIETTEDADGRTRVRFGDLSIEVDGEGSDGLVIIRNGDDEILRVEGGAVEGGGGSARTEPEDADAPAAPEPPATPDAPAAPEAAPEPPAAPDAPAAPAPPAAAGG